MLMANWQCMAMFKLHWNSFISLLNGVCLTMSWSYSMHVMGFITKLQLLLVYYGLV